jgi:hypothetical protein
MAKSKDLPAYKEAQRLVCTLYDSTKKAPREFRLTLVQRLLSEVVDLVVDIDTANRSSAEERVRCLLEIQKRMSRIDTLIFVGMEQRCLSRGAASKAILQIDSLSRQISGWLSFTKSQLPTRSTSDGKSTRLP